MRTNVPDRHGHEVGCLAVGVKTAPRILFSLSRFAVHSSTPCDWRSYSQPGLSVGGEPMRRREVFSQRRANKSPHVDFLILTNSQKASQEKVLTGNESLEAAVAAAASQLQKQQQQLKKLQENQLRHHQQLLQVRAPDFPEMQVVCCSSHSSFLEIALKHMAPEKKRTSNFCIIGRNS